MDRSRRRFLPSPDGLEVRTMLSTATAAAAGSGALAAATDQELPVTFQQKLQRIDNVPQNLRSLDRNRFLPKDTVAAIQQGLTDIMGRMDPPSPYALASYNSAMRDIAFNDSLSKDSAAVLNARFIGALRSGNAPEEAVQQLAAAVNDLVTRVDTASIRPVFLATNDNAYILQLAIVLGQPMPSPRVPTIASGSGQQVQPGNYTTTQPRPTFNGSYESGTTMQLIDQATDEILGQTVVGSDGQYALRVSDPLQANTTYKLRVRAIDVAGHVSNPSREFQLRVNAPKPQAKIQTHAAQLLVGEATPRGPAAHAQASTSGGKPSTR